MIWLVCQGEIAYVRDEKGIYYVWVPRRNELYRPGCYALEDGTTINDVETFLSDNRLACREEDSA